MKSNSFKLTLAAFALVAISFSGLSIAQTAAQTAQSDQPGVGAVRMSTNTLRTGTQQATPTSVPVQQQATQAPQDQNQEKMLEIVR